MIPLYSSEPPERKKAIAGVALAAAYIRQQDPFSPAPYLMLRGLRWGELRAAAELSDPSLLEAPPTELRQHIKHLALNGKWEDLLEAAEGAMTLPCGRAWLDLQRFVVEGCEALGKELPSNRQGHPIRVENALAGPPSALGDDPDGRHGCRECGNAGLAARFIARANGLGRGSEAGGADRAGPGQRRFRRFKSRGVEKEAR